MLLYIINNLIPTIITSSIVVGLATWFLKKYFSRRIDNAFHEREKKLESRLRQNEKHRELIFNISSELLPKIQEVVYRSRNLMRETVECKDLRHLDNLIGYWSQLSDNLYKYQLFLPDHTFELLHKYKRTYQNIVMMLNSSLNEGVHEGINGSVDCSNSIIPENDLMVLKDQLPTIDKLYSDILSQLRLIIQSYE